jgi:hypothetical protein
MNFHIDWVSVTAIATVVYGFATLALVFQLREDRSQRIKQFNVENEAKKLNDLRGAFYEAAGYWLGHRWSAGSVRIDSSQVGKQFEALVRLECQLRLNDYRTEANNLGFAIRNNFQDINSQLAKAGIALGLLPTEYRSLAVEASVVAI